MTGMHRWLGWLLACTFMTVILATNVSVTSAFAAPNDTLQIIHMNDIHARVDESDVNFGYANIASIINDLKAKHPNTIVLDAGDTLHGQTIANLVRGESIIDILNLLGIDAMVAGNHDFNYGRERLLELSAEARFPILAANIYQEDGTRFLSPYTFLEAGPWKVAVFGLATPETEYKTHPDNVTGLRFTDPVEEARQLVAELEGQADVIIALTHLGLDEWSSVTSKLVAEQVPGIDLIVDGHSHTVLENGMVVNDVLIAQAGDYGRHVGVIELKMNDEKKAIEKRASLISRVEADRVEPDASVAELIASLKLEQKPILDEVVGTTTIDLDGEQQRVRVGETNLGRLIADAMLALSDADVAIVNGGMIRGSIPAGDITKGQIFTVLPFGNYIQTKKVKGADIKAALEHGVSFYPNTFAGFPHVGGMSFELNAAAPAGQRVQNLMVGDQPIDLDGEYVLALNDFMAAGGDRYTMFKDKPVAHEFASLDDAVIEYLHRHGEASPTAKARITIREATEESAQLQEEHTQPLDELQNRVYIVKRGDTLWAIAQRFGTIWQTLHRLNPIKDPNLIFPGQAIVLPH